MIISLTGTPGTGKTTVSAALRQQGHNVIDLSSYVKENGLLGDYDANMDTNEVDVEKLKEHLGHSLDRKDSVFMEGHLSHFLDPDMIIVLRCDPEVIEQRLRERGYSDEKIKENVRSEVLDVILCESTDAGKDVFEIDCTGKDTNNIISSIYNILEGNTEGYMPGSVSWWTEMDKWF